MAIHFVAFVAGVAPAVAQSSPEDLLEQYRRGQLEQAGPNAPLPETTRILQPNLVRSYRLQVSALEKSYSERANVDLRLFGYEAFGEPGSVTVRQSGALGDGYILGAGDQLRIDLRGQENQSYTIQVGRDGTVTLPRMQPILAAGQQLGDFRRELQSQVGRLFLETQSFVSVGQVRQITVLVAGEVNAPGTVSVSALNSPVDAILLAGGIKKTGSLRAIRIRRGEETIPVDFYIALGAAGGSFPAFLADGDQIVVPPIGPTVAIAGEVTRPGIFELGPGRSGMQSDELVRTAGGFLLAGQQRLTVLKVAPDGSETLTPIAPGGRSELRKGDIVFVQASTNVARGRIVVEGRMRVPGTFDTSRTPTLKSLFTSAEVLEEGAYGLFAVVSRRDPATLSRTLIPFAPIEVLRGQSDMPLQGDDIVRVFSTEEVRRLIADISLREIARDPTGQDLRKYRDLDSEAGARKEDQTKREDDESNLSRERGGTVQAALASERALDEEEALIAAERRRELQERNRSRDEFPVDGSRRETDDSQRDYEFSTVSEDDRAAGPADGRERAPRDRERKEMTSRSLLLDINDPTLLSQLANFRISIIGAVRSPGVYLAAPGAGLVAAAGAAGGLSNFVDLSGIEITSTNYDAVAGQAKTQRTSYALRPGELSRLKVNPSDVVRFREVYSDRDGGQIVVRGQVRFPGTFDILRGERLSSVLARAGGLTEIAYPYGAIFMREGAARIEEDGYRRAAAELERQFTLLVSDEAISPEGVRFIRDTIERLQTAEGVGRVSIEADPVKLAAKPEQDTILEPGDFLFIPRRPNSVSVTGEVLAAGSFVYSAGRNSRDYVRMAGGYSIGADRDRTFIIMPDGTARPIRDGLLTFGNAGLVPGATIVVPRDLTPFRFQRFALDFTQIFSQLAVSAASIAVISREN